MRRVTVKSIKGNEELAREVYTDHGAVIMPKGTIVKKEYVDKLIDLGITYVYVEDDLSKGVEFDNILGVQIKENCVDQVKKVLETYCTGASGDLSELAEVAETIIAEVLLNPQMIYSMSDIRSSSDITYSHSINVCALSVYLGLRLGLKEEILKSIARGALLHDIGMSLLPQELSEKPEAELSKEEIRVKRMHVIKGYELIQNVDWLEEHAKKIVLTHHERIDGSGYPFGLKMSKVTIGSRIVSLCDTFDRIVYSGINEEKVNPILTATAHFAAQRGILYDKTIVDAFMYNIALYPSGTGVLTNHEDKAIVLKQNVSNPASPVIRLIEDRDGKRYEDWIEIDLLKAADVEIVCAIDL